MVEEALLALSKASAQAMWMRVQARYRGDVGGFQSGGKVVVDHWQGAGKAVVDAACSGVRRVDQLVHDAFVGERPRA